MRIETINAFSYEEAKTKAREMGLNVIKNVTSSFKKNPDMDIKEFANYIFERDKVTNIDGIAYMIVKDPGTPDTKKRPYLIANKVHSGPMIKRRVFEIRTAETDKFVGEADSKAAAMKLAKENMSTFKEDFLCKVVYKLDDAHSTAFSVKYIPATKTKLGTYIVIGN